MPDITNPLYFVGPFDPRSVVLAAVFLAPWLIVLAWGKLRNPWLWVALAVAAASFPFSIAWVQVAIQLAIGNFLGSVLTADTLTHYIAIAGAPSILVSGLVQEGVKLIIAAAVLLLIWRERKGWSALAIGAAVGAGYGGFEAFWIFNTVFATGWSWGMVDLNGLVALLPFFERFYAVPFHIGAVALSAYILSRGRPVTGFLVAAGLHALLNYGALLLQIGFFDILEVEVWGAAIAFATVGTAIWIKWWKARPEMEVKASGGGAV